MQIPAAKIYFPEDDRKELLKQIDGILASGQLTLGKYSREFEQRFAEYVGTKYAVAVNSGTTSDVITHGVNGILLEEAEIDRLPSEISRLLDDDALCRSLGKAARQFILDNWPSWEERVAQEVHLLEEVVKRHRERAGRAGNSVAHR